MPFKSEKIKIQGTMFDRRRKLDEETKEIIRKEYNTGLIGQRPLAKKYGVSRSLIQVIVNPEIAEKKKQRIKEHWKDYQKFGEEHNKEIAKTRRYKHELFLSGKVKG
jgi:DNA invertase Pin-like site-specific DNA recombinase